MLWPLGAAGQVRSHPSRICCALVVVFVMLLLPVEVRAAKGEFTPSVNDFGSTGLLQMPNARFHPDGELNLGVSRVEPYTRGYLTLQGLPWAEGTFRYTDIANRRFSPVESFSGDQSFKDRSADVKILLIEESANFAQVAVQLRDIGGTDLFGSEFIVASKRYYNWDFTVGLAWGNAGSRGHIKNPFVHFSDSFKDRGSSGGAGALGFDFFRGERVAFFGGIEYITPIEGLRLKVEYDGNSYQDEPLGNRLDVDLPWNFGVEYDVFSWLRLAAAFERGNEFMIRGNIRSNLNTDKGITKRDDPPPKVPPRKSDAVVNAQRRPSENLNIVIPKGPDRAYTAIRLTAALRESGLSVEDIQIDGDTAIVRLSTDAAAPATEVLANAALLVSRADFGTRIERVKFAAPRPSGELTAATFERADLERSISMTGSAVALVEPPSRTWLALFGTGDQSETAVASATKPKVDQREAVRQVGNKVFAELRQQSFWGEHFDIRNKTATLYFRQSKFRNPAQAIGRAARAVARHAPHRVEVITVTATEDGVPVAKTTIIRRDLENALQAKGSPEELWQNASVESAGLPQDTDTSVESDNAYPRLSWAVLPQMRNQIGGPDDFFFTQLYGRGSAGVLVAPGLSVRTSVGVNIYNNFDSLKLESDSRLPRVRSDIAKYLKEGEQWIDVLDINYITKLTPDVYGRVSAGIFELMFAGVGGEVLYRPQGQRWALGLDMNYVKQRDFDGLFGFQDYEVLTGHVSYYHRLPYYEILSTVSVGRYLAKDVGATLELSRTFDSGVSFGVFATVTDVSSEEFGEGSFDKGFFMSIPLDLFFEKSNRRRTGFTFRPVTRDGGARLAVPKRLYSVSEGSNYDRIDQGWDKVLD